MISIIYTQCRKKDLKGSKESKKNPSFRKIDAPTHNPFLSPS